MEPKTETAADVRESEINRLYHEIYDAWYDGNTGVWLEDKCNDPDCEHCKDRPDNALHVRESEVV